MSLLKRKTEDALAGYIRTLFEGTGVHVFSGKNQAEKILPCIVVYADRKQPHPQFPADMGISVISVGVHVLTSAYDEAMREHDARAIRVFEALTDDAAVKAALNIHEPDTREVTSYHLYDLSLRSGDEGMKDDTFGESFEFEAICQGVDGSPS